MNGDTWYIIRVNSDLFYNHSMKTLSKDIYKACYFNNCDNAIKLANSILVDKVACGQIHPETVEVIRKLDDDFEDIEWKRSYGDSLGSIPC